MLAVVTAVNNANADADGSPQALLAASVVSITAAALGVAATLRRRRAEVPAAEAALEAAA